MDDSMAAPVKARIRLWVKALESGKYRQGRESLVHRGRYCCLGVACDVFRKKTKQGQWIYPNGRREPGTFMGKETLPPSEVMRWYGLDKLDPTLHDYLTATECNDMLLESFNQIANRLKVRYLGGKQRVYNPGCRLPRQ